MKNRIALKIALIYFLLGFTWILFSDHFLLSFVGSVAKVTALQTYKGWFYVCITAILLFILIQREIRKKNLIEENLIKAKQKAEESDLLKSAFLSNMSHEIRTPLNGILGFCELLVDDSFTDEEKRIFAKNLTKNGNELLKLINDIMDISKIQGKQFYISKKQFSLNSLINSLYQEYQQSDVKSIRDQISFRAIYGVNSTEIEIYSDPVRLSHILRNLLNNAFFFTNEGYIHFGFEETGAGVELFVEDTGCGIDELSKDQIFKPFFKGKNPVVGNRGFGLGLAISKGLVKLLGSDLLFTSEVNKGTRFYFRIDEHDIVSMNMAVRNNAKSGFKLKSIFFDQTKNRIPEN